MSYFSRWALKNYKSGKNLAIVWCCRETFSLGANQQASNQVRNSNPVSFCLGEARGNWDWRKKLCRGWWEIHVKTNNQSTIYERGWRVLILSLKLFISSDLDCYADYEENYLTFAYFYYSPFFSPFFSIDSCPWRVAVLFDLFLETPTQFLFVLEKQEETGTDGKSCAEGDGKFMLRLTTNPPFMREVDAF